MRRLQNDERPWDAVYELPDGRRFTVDSRLLQQYGLAELIRGTELEQFWPTERVPVFQHNKQIGTMAPDFDPYLIKSKSFLYDPRPGDFTRTQEGWVAAPTLGPRDFEMVPGFIRDN